MAEKWNIDNSIDYLMGVDPREWWPDDLSFPPSPEDYGIVCSLDLKEVAGTNVEALAALIHGALKHDDERVRCACANALEDVHPQAARAIYILQSFDGEGYVRDLAIESLWHLSQDDPTPARKVVDRLLTDSDEDVRDTARLYKASDDGPPVVYTGQRGGRYVVDRDGKRRYLKD